MGKQLQETPTRASPQNRRQGKRGCTPARLVLRVVLGLMALGLVVVGAAGAILLNRPEMLGLSNTLSAEVSKLTGLDCRVTGPVEVSIFPAPHIQVYGLSLFAPAPPAPAGQAPPAGGADAAAPAANATRAGQIAPESTAPAASAAPVTNATIPNAPLLNGQAGQANGGAVLYQAAAHPQAAQASRAAPLLTVAALRVDLKIFSLFSGELGLRRVELFDPRLDLDACRALWADKTPDSSAAPQGQAAGGAAAAIAPPANATMAGQSAPGSAPDTAPDIAANATLAAPAPPAGGSAAVPAPAGAQGAPDPAALQVDAAALLDMLPEIAINGGVVLERDGQGLRRVLVGGLKLVFEDNDLNFSLFSHALGAEGDSVSSLEGRVDNLAVSGPELKAKARLAAELNVLDQTLRPEISADLTYDLAAQRLDLANFALAMEKLRITGNLAAGVATGGFQVTGHLEHSGLSLPRWFQFGRNLPGSLQYALDDLSGRMDFDLNEDRLVVTNMVTRVLNMTLSGSGGTPDFGAPDVVIDARGDFLDVNAIFPEVVDPPPDDPPRVHYAEPPLVGGGNVDDSDLPDVGHDIKISGAKALVRKLAINDLAVRIVPSERGTQCLFSIGGVAGGKLNADLTVLEDSDDIEIDAKPAGISVKALSEGLFPRAPFDAAVSGRAKVTADPDTLGVFFRTMAVDFDLKFGAGTLFLRETNRKLAFDSVAASGRGASQQGQTEANSMLMFDGVWNYQAGSGKEKLKATLNGPLGIDENSLDLFTPGGDLSAEGHVDMAFLGLKPEGAVKFSGRLSYDDRARTLGLGKAAFTLPYGTATGDISCKEQGFAGEAWRGAVKLSVPSTRDWLVHMGLGREDLPAEGLEKGEFSFSFEQGGPKWAIKDAALFVDGKTRGVLNFAQAGVDNYTFSLNLETINMDDYYPSRKSSSPLPSPQPWNLSGFLKTRLKGDINIKDLVWRKLHYTNMTAHLTLENGKFSLPVSAGFYGGKNTAGLTGTLEPNRINSQLSLEFKNAQLAGMTKDLYADERAAGPLSVSLLANGAPGRTSEIITAFSGQWSFDVGAGYFRGKRDEHTGKEPTKTEFSAVRASGRLAAGRLESDNFTLSAPKSTDTVGRGYVDIDKNTIDMELEVRMLGINVPVRVVGSLDAPQTKVKSGKLIGNAVSGIGSGLFGLVVDVISLPGKVIMLPFDQHSGGEGSGGSGVPGGSGGSGGGSGGGAGGSGTR